MLPTDFAYSLFGSFAEIPCRSVKGDRIPFHSVWYINITYYFFASSASKRDSASWSALSNSGWKATLFTKSQQLPSSPSQGNAWTRRQAILFFLTATLQFLEVLKQQKDPRAGQMLNGIRLPKTLCQHAPTLEAQIPCQPFTYIIWGWRCPSAGGGGKTKRAFEHSWSAPHQACDIRLLQARYLSGISFQYAKRAGSYVAGSCSINRQLKWS